MLKIPRETTKQDILTFRYQPIACHESLEIKTGHFIGRFELLDCGNHASTVGREKRGRCSSVVSHKYKVTCAESQQAMFFK